MDLKGLLFKTHHFSKSRFSLKSPVSYLYYALVVAKGSQLPWLSSFFPSSISSENITLNSNTHRVPSISHSLGTVGMNLNGSSWTHFGYTKYLIPWNAMDIGISKSTFRSFTLTRPFRLMVVCKPIFAIIIGRLWYIQSICLSICLSTHPSAWSIHPPTHPSICMY